MTIMALPLMEEFFFVRGRGSGNKQLWEAGGKEIALPKILKLEITLHITACAGGVLLRRFGSKITVAWK